MKTINTKEELLALPEGSLILFYGRRYFGYWPHLKICQITKSDEPVIETCLRTVYFPTQQEYEAEPDSAWDYCYIDEERDLTNKSHLRLFGFTSDSRQASVWVLDEDEIEKHVLMENL